MRRIFIAALSVGLALALAGTAVASLPRETPAETYGVNGVARSTVVVGDTVWIGGKFTQITNGNSLTGTVRQSVGLAALSKTTGQIAAASVPRLTGDAVEVWKLATDGVRVYAAGKFTYDNTTNKFLISFDGTTGGDVITYNAPQVMKSVTVANGVVYAGGTKLFAFPVTGGARLWAGSAIRVDLTLRDKVPGAAYRDLELGDDGKLYAACQCDQLVNGPFVKALVRFDPATGTHDPSWTPEQTDPTVVQPGAAFGFEVDVVGQVVYLAAGGSDFVGAYKTTDDGSYAWGGRIDTSGSAQAIWHTGSELIVGGHFQLVEDRGTSSQDCRSNQTPDLACAARLRLMALDPSNGDLLPWAPDITPRYNGIWGIWDDGSSVHLVGDFLKIEGVSQTHYGRLDVAPLG